MAFGAAERARHGIFNALDVSELEPSGMRAPPVADQEIIGDAFFSGLVTRCPPMKRFVKGHILAVVCVLFVIMEAPRTVLPHFERWNLQ